MLYSVRVEPSMKLIENLKNAALSKAVIRQRIDKMKRWFALWNIFSLVFYTVFTVILVVNTWHSPVYVGIILGIMFVYIAVSSLVMVFSRTDKRVLKGRVKDYKSGMRILRALIRILALSLNITAFVGVFGITDSKLLKVLGVLSLLFFITKAVVEIYSVVSRHLKHSRHRSRARSGRIWGVIFDLDGTLVDTLGDLTAAVNYALYRLGLPARSQEEVRSFIGNGVRKLMERAVAPSDQYVNEAYALFTDYYEKHLLDRSHPYDGIPLLLEYLFCKDIKIGVVSNKYDKAVKMICAKLFAGKIDYIVGTDPAIRPKPETDGLKKAMSKLKLKPQNVLYVGDSEVDFTTAYRAGVEFLGAGWGFGTINSPADVIYEPCELIDYL